MPRHHPHRLHRCFAFAGLPRHHPHHLHRCFAFCRFASASPASSAPLFCFLQVCLGITPLKQHRCFASRRFASASPTSSALLFCFLQVCLGITLIICTAVLFFAGLPRHHPHHLQRCFAFCRFASASPASCTAALLFAGLFRHHPHHLHRRFAFCTFASVSSASSAPVLLFAGLPRHHCTAVLLLAGLLRHHQHHLHRCRILQGFALTLHVCLGITRIKLHRCFAFCRFASASPASSAPLFCFLQVCFGITRIICITVLLFAGLPRHQPHHLHRCFASCGFAPASPASFVPLPHSAGFCFVFAGLPRHHPHRLHRCFAFCRFASASPASSAPLFCFLQVCLGITPLKQHRCFASRRFASASPTSSALLFCFLQVCLGITLIICTAVLFFAGLPRHHPHHLQRCFAFCRFASASPASCTAALLFAGLFRHHPHHLHRRFAFCTFASVSSASSAPVLLFAGLPRHHCTAVLLLAGLLRHHQHHLHRCRILQGFALTLHVCLGITRIKLHRCFAFCRFASASPASSAPLFCFLQVCFGITRIICITVLLFAGLPRHQPHHLHRCFASCGFAPASPASFVPLPHSAGFCFVFAGLPRHHPHYLHRCFVFCRFASASPASSAPLLCFLPVCLVITRIICTAVLLFAGLPRHHPHHLHRCFAFCRFASASPASFASLFCFSRVCLGITRIICTAVLLFAGLPRHHPHHLHLQVCLCITRIICTAASSNQTTWPLGGFGHEFRLEAALLHPLPVQLPTLPRQEQHLPLTLNDQILDQRPLDEQVAEQGSFNKGGALLGGFCDPLEKDPSGDTSYRHFCGALHRPNRVPKSSRGSICSPWWFRSEIRACVKMGGGGKQARVSFLSCSVAPLFPLFVGSLSEFMNFNFFGKTILVVSIKLGLFWGPSTQPVRTFSSH